jgi:ligand-binding SRPBCC domain-containing protein
VGSFDIASELAAPPEVVWQRLTSIDGVNGELMPLMRMTVPRHLRGATLDQLPLGQRAGRSWVLLFGVFPVDYDDLTIVERGPGHRFFEQSTMGTQRRWNHERIVEPAPGGCRVVDRLSWSGRTGLFDAMYRNVVPMLFGHRHRRLRKRFGELGTGR